MGDAQDKDVLVQNNEDHAIISDPLFFQSRKRAFKEGSGIRMFRKFPFDGVEDAPGLGFIQPLEIPLNGQQLQIGGNSGGARNFLR